MEIGRVQGATRVVGKSQGYYGLPLRDEVHNLGDLPHMLLTLQNSAIDGENTPVMVTAWLPSPDELARLAAGAPLLLRVVGMMHPPVMLEVGDAPDDVPPTKATSENLTRPVEVALNGNPVSFVTEYDMTEGYIVQAMIDSEGYIMHDADGNLRTVRVNGVITVKWK